MSITWSGTSWAVATAYAFSARSIAPIGAANAPGNVYRCTVAGMSAATGTGPSGTSTAITDNSVTWKYLGVNEGAVTDVAPDLSTVSAAMQAAILDIVEELLDPVVWGNRLAAGQKFLAAHFAAFFLRGSGAGVGAVSSESEGPLSISYATPGSTAAVMGSLDATPHGISYLFLLGTLPRAVLGLVV